MGDISSSKPLFDILLLLMALSLFLPLLQMLTFSRQPVVDEQAIVRSVARVRTQRLCEQLVRIAIEQNRLTESVGSCMEWSCRLSSGQLRQVVRCHELSGPDELAFAGCVLNRDIHPPGINLPNTQSF